MENQQEQNPVAVIVSRIVERDDIRRAKLIIEIERSIEAGGDGWQNNDEIDAEGMNWRRFWINFSEKYPGAAAFAPVAVACYLFLIYQLIF